MSYVAAIVFMVWGFVILPPGRATWYEIWGAAGLCFLASIAESVHEMAKRGRKPIRIGFEKDSTR